MSIYYHRGPITLGRIITGIAPRIRIGWLILFTLFLILGGFAHAHDITRPDLDSWFNQLKSGKGYCCSNGDGTALSDVDWDATGGHYRVRIDGEWIAVPDEAVITEPNLAERTSVKAISQERSGQVCGSRHKQMHSIRRPLALYHLLFCIWASCSYPEPPPRRSLSRARSRRPGPSSFSLKAR